MTKKEFIIILVSRGTPRDKITIENGLINVDGDVNISDLGLTKIPYPFGVVSGKFVCSFNQLRTLEGTPKEVTGNFSCSHNKLTTLKGAPQYVGGDFFCNKNQLTTLEGAPLEVVDYFDCSFNNLTSLEGSPLKVGGHFDCSFNNLTSLEGSPLKVGGGFDCSYNKLTTLEGAPLVGFSIVANGNPFKKLLNLKLKIELIDGLYINCNKFLNHYSNIFHINNKVVSHYIVKF